MNLRRYMGLLVGCAASLSIVNCAPADDEDFEPEVGEGADALSKTTKFAPIADAEVSQATPNTNLGTATKLGSDSDPNRRSYLRFAVSGLQGAVQSAKLRCYTTNGTTNGPSLFVAGSGWEERTIKWSNRPATSGAALGDLGAISANTWIEYDVSKVVRGNGTYNFAIVPTSTDSIECNSREAASNKPELVVSFAAPDPTPTTTTTTPPPPPPSSGIACPAGFGTEVFRDDFNGSAVDGSKWDVIQQNSGGGGSFTQLTKMLTNNVTVSGGRLHIASKRHCTDPYADKNAPENAAKCAGTNYYSGGWVKAKTGYAPGKGLMIFQAKMPTPVQGIFPALWARNTKGDQFYGEFDLIEQWWDVSGKGKASSPDVFAVTTWLGTNAQFHTPSAAVGPFAGLTTALHVWEVEWDANASPAVARYYYRDTPTSARTLLNTVTAQSSGLAGKVSEDQFKTALSDGFRPYVDFAVQPDSAWHVGPDTAAVYNPDDVEVDSVIVCKP